MGPSPDAGRLTGDSCGSPWGSACGVTALISAIGIIGRKRMKRRNSTEKTPNVPKNVKMSTIVGLIVAPARRQEVAVQRGHDDDEALEPHADVDEDREDRT